MARNMEINVSIIAEDKKKLFQSAMNTELTRLQDLGHVIRDIKLAIASSGQLAVSISQKQRSIIGCIIYELRPTQ